MSSEVVTPDGNNKNRRVRSGKEVSCTHHVRHCNPAGRKRRAGLDRQGDSTAMTFVLPAVQHGRDQSGWKSHTKRGVTWQDGDLFVRWV